MVRRAGHVEGALSLHVGGGEERRSGSKWVCLLDGVSLSGEREEWGARKGDTTGLWEKREGKKGVERRVVIFIKNVPRGSDASYEIVALTAAKLRLSRPKSRPQTGAY